LALLEWTKKTPVPDGVFYNVNIPNLDPSEIKGVLVTKKGIRRYVDKISKVKTPFGGEAYWIGGSIEDFMSEGTDVWAVANDYVSITPVHMEMTSFITQRECREAGMESFIEKAILKN